MKEYLNAILLMLYIFNMAICFTLMHVYYTKNKPAFYAWMFGLLQIINLTFKLIIEITN